MAEPFAVDLGRLTDLIDRMGAYQKAMDSILGEVDTMVTGLHQNWDGAASQAHTEAHEQWKVGADQMRKALAQLRDAGAHAHASYHAAVEVNKSMWE